MLTGKKNVRITFVQNMKAKGKLIISIRNVLSIFFSFYSILDIQKITENQNNTNKKEENYFNGNKLDSQNNMNTHKHEEDPFQNEYDLLEIQNFNWKNHIFHGVQIMNNYSSSSLSDMNENIDLQFAAEVELVRDELYANLKGELFCIF